MSWKTHVTARPREGDQMGYSDTQHYNTELPEHHALVVTHLDYGLESGGSSPTHAVSIYHGTREGTGGPQNIRLHFPTMQHPDKAMIVHDPGARTTHSYVKAPSPELRDLIEQHHRHANNTGAWAALLDKLAEEYPDMQPAVDAHVAARYSS